MIPPITRRTTSATRTMRTIARVLTRPSYGPGSVQDVPSAEVRHDLALHALQRVVDGLRVAADPLADLLVATPVEVERQHPGLELGEGGRQAADERPQLLGGDDLVDRVVDPRPGDHLVERRLAVRGARGRLRERDVLVQRRVLVARRGLHRRDDLAGDAELGEVAEARLPVRPVVPDRLVQADEALLDEVVGVPAREEVRRGLQPHEAVVAADEPVVGRRIASLGEGDEVAVVDLKLCLRLTGESCHERTFLFEGIELSGALLPWRQLPYEDGFLKLRLTVKSAATLAGLWSACQGSSRRCKIPYSSAAAAALTLSDPTRPRIGSATSWSHAPATRGRRPRPSLP